MNRTRMSSVELEKALARKLRELLEGVPWLRHFRVERNPAAFDRAFDIEASLPLPGGVTAELWVECKADPRPSEFPYVNVSNQFGERGKRRVRVPLLAAPHVSPRMAEICWNHGWSWFDLAGNCRLSVPGAFYLERTGQEPVHERPNPAANLGTPEAARIIRALLALDNAGRRWTQRGVQLHCQPRVSLGLVNKIVRYLAGEAFVEGLRDGGFCLRKPLELLATWREAYRFDRHQRRSYFTLLKGNALREALWGLEAITGGHAAYAAFSAADFQAPHVRQPKTWLFVGAEHEEAFREVAEAQQVDSGENLVVLIPDDDGVFYLREGGGIDERSLACTNPVQTYVDLCHCAGRGQEGAEALLEQKLKPAWKLRGLL